MPAFIPSIYFKVFWKIAFVCFVVVFLSLPVSCKRKPPFDVNLSSIKAEPLSIKRYEQVLFRLDTANLRSEIEPYISDFYLFLGDEINTPQGQQQLIDYISEPFNRELFNDVSRTWGSLDELEKQLMQTFRYLRYHFPDAQTPEVFTYISGIDFEFPVYYEDGVVVIALDMFMGKDYINYDRARVPVFKRTRFVPEAVAVEVARAMGRDILNRSGNRPESLLDFMVKEGKLLYFIDAMLPSVPDSLKIYYTSEQISWATRNEGHAWAFLLNNEMLYSADRQIIQKLTEDAPFTSFYSTGSAPRMGSYKGWQIVRGFMERNSDIPLTELMFELNDSQAILSGSRYRP